MNLKNRKRVMMTLMSLMLATTGCSSSNKDRDNYSYNYKEYSYGVIENILDSQSFYNDDYKSEKDAYATFYQNYLDSFIEYMSEDQYNLFISLAQNMNKEERNEYPETLKYMNAMFNVKEDSYGRGFYKIFNSRIIGENVTFNGRVGGNLNNHINNLVAIVNNDDELFASIFSGDINNVIDCIVKNTGIENRELVEELILKMDLYTDMLSYNDYKIDMLEEAYYERINDIISKLITSKRAYDSNFSKSFYSSLLNGSVYRGYDTYEIRPGITTNTFEIIVYEDGEKYSIKNIDKSYLYSNCSIEEIREYAVNDILARSFNLEKEEYYTVENTMQLLMCLIDSNISFNDIENGDDLRKIIYNNLSKYFTSEDDFNTFVLKLCSMSNRTLDQYFNFFIDSIKTDGITYDDFLRYLCLVNYNNKRRHINIDYVDSDNRIKSEELANMTEEEYKDIASSREENYFFCTLEYQKYFDQIAEVLSQNDLGYEMVYNKDCKFEWIYGEKELIAESETSFISSEVFPETMEFGGTNIIFYEYPEYYKEGVPVEVFTNINNETTTREREGFKTEIIDPKTGEVRLIYVVDMTSSIAEYDPIRFMIDAKTFNNNYANNNSKSAPTLGGNNE